MELNQPLEIRAICAAIILKGRSEKLISLQEVSLYLRYLNKLISDQTVIDLDPKKAYLRLRPIIKFLTFPQLAKQYSFK